MGFVVTVRFDEQAPTCLIWTVSQHCFKQGLVDSGGNEQSTEREVIERRSLAGRRCWRSWQRCIPGVVRCFATAALDTAGRRPKGMGEGVDCG